jgi:hypothetical protein
VEGAANSVENRAGAVNDTSVSAGTNAGASANGR